MFFGFFENLQINFQRFWKFWKFIWRFSKKTGKSSNTFSGILCWFFFDFWIFFWKSSNKFSKFPKCVWVFFCKSSNKFLKKNCSFFSGIGPAGRTTFKSNEQPYTTVWMQLASQWIRVFCGGQLNEKNHLKIEIVWSKKSEILNFPIFSDFQWLSMQKFSFFAEPIFARSALYIREC